MRKWRDARSVRCKAFRGKPATGCEADRRKPIVDRSLAGQRVAGQSQPSMPPIGAPYGPFARSGWAVERRTNLGPIQSATVQRGPQLRAYSRAIWRASAAVRSKARRPLEGEHHSSTKKCRAMDWFGDPHAHGAAPRFRLRRARASASRGTNPLDPTNAARRQTRCPWPFARCSWA